LNAYKVSANTLFKRYLIRY